MPALHEKLRKQLEKTVIAARDIAEDAATEALKGLAVDQAKPFDHMTPDERELRNKLRAKARQLGDHPRHPERPGHPERSEGSRSEASRSGVQAIDHLVTECAYEHWHRMLFARFLAENHLLIHDEEGVPVSLEECEELAKDEGIDGWTLAARFASRMLPQIFRPDDPVLAVTLAPESKRALEKMLDTLPPEVFTADDSLGWVYQFWQDKRKDEVNASGVKIGADELPAVTQLFTEHYMVLFLLHNTLGAWWAGKVAAASSRWSSCTTEQEARQLCALPGVSWDYLRFIEPEPIGFYQKEAPVEKTAANLPHWRQEGVTYFITFRTADSLPRERLQQWLTEKAQWLEAHPEPRDDETMQEYYKRFPERIEHWLDQGHGACHLKRAAIRKIVEDALRHFDGQRYDLDECTVAGNHVHALVTPKDGHALSDILHAWKSFTANKINKVLGQTGAFWQKESFDHIVRSAAQLERIREYIRGHEVEAASSRLNCLNPQKRQDATLGQKRQDAASTLRPAAGTFSGWPTEAKDLKILDPCCGSGHFLVAAFDLMVRIRMKEEGLSPRDACDAVLRDNIFGLEIDPRCTQIAAFALALSAWKFPARHPERSEGSQTPNSHRNTEILRSAQNDQGDALGYRELPELHIACSGVGPHTTEEQWLQLAEQSGVPMPALGKQPIREGLRNLHALFSQAPTLGSLIDPSELPADLIAADYETLQPYLAAALSAEHGDDEARERTVAAAGMVKAAELLASEYTLVITNVPYLMYRKQEAILQRFSEHQCPSGKADLATVFLSRCMNFCRGVCYF